MFGMRLLCSPIGTDTPTNLPFCNAGPVFGTKFPRMMPVAMANMIQSARNRSSHPRPLNAETLSGAIAASISCFSVSWVFAGLSDAGGWFLEGGDLCIVAVVRGLYYEIFTSIKCSLEKWWEMLGFVIAYVR